MATVPNLSPDATPAAPPKKATRPQGAAQQWYRVKNGSPTGGPHRVPRPGGDFYLNRGKTISSASYNIQQLLNMGVELEPIDEPGWHAAKQGNGDDHEAT